MPDSSNTPYRIVLVGLLGDKIRTLAARADAAGIGQTFRDTLGSIVVQLRDQPLLFGEARYHLRTLQLQVRIGLLDLLSVRYAVDEVRRIVYLLDIDPLSGRGLS